MIGKRKLSDDPHPESGTPDSNRVDAIVVDGQGAEHFLRPIGRNVQPSGIHRGGQKDGRTHHPLGGVLVHVLSIVRVLQDFDFFLNLMGRHECYRAMVLSISREVVSIRVYPRETRH
jgi:hypothetical protein